MPQTKEERSAQRRLYYQKNKEILVAKQKIYVANNKEIIAKKRQENKEKIKIYKLENKEKIALREKIYRGKNKEKKAATSKIYYVKNMDKFIEYRNRPEILKYQRVYKWKESGVISNDFDALYEVYLNTTECSVCSVELTEEKKSTKTRKCLDHCHKTGEFRDILCNSCNVKRG
tara:strand:+ start:267 stop:788 length:522 start_codon:yes stop_codon:yes gene_type:complete